MAKIVQIKKAKAIVICLAAILLLGSCGKDYVNPGGGGTLAGTSGSLARFVISNNILYTVSTDKQGSYNSSSQLTSYDISDPANPVVQKNSGTYTSLDNIFSYQNYLYIGGQNGMSIYDITNSPNPVFKSTYNAYRTCDVVVANSQYAFLSQRSTSTCGGAINQVSVVDISNPLQPNQVYSYPMTQPYGLALDGNYLFVCDGGVKFYDIGNIATPILKQKVIIDAKDVIAQNSKLTVIGDDGLYQYNYSGGTLNFLSKLNLN